MRYWLLDDEQVKVVGEHRIERQSKVKQAAPQDQHSRTVVLLYVPPVDTNYQVQVRT
jgi:hypothetical protein